MKNGFGLAVLALVSAAAGAAVAMFAMKKQEELEQFDYDFDDEDEIYFDDDDEECCCGCEECGEEVSADEADVEKELDAIEDEVEDTDTADEVPKPEKGDF